MDRPTLYLTNFASRKPPFRGPGRLWTAMARPRPQYGECGEGAVPLLIPTGREVEMMTRAVTLRGTPEGRGIAADYRAVIEGRWRDIGASGFASPLLTAWSGTNAYAVKSGDTVCCACARSERAAGRCHLAWAVPFLVRAGWRVVLDGEEVRDGG